jgi:hypothetical protein
MARAANVSYSRFMAGLIGDRLREIEKALRQFKKEN